MSFNFPQQQRRREKGSLLPPKTPARSTLVDALQPQHRPQSRAGRDRSKNQQPLASLAAKTNASSSVSSATGTNTNKRKLGNGQTYATNASKRRAQDVDDSAYRFIHGSNNSSHSVLSNDVSDAQLPSALASVCNAISSKEFNGVPIPRKTQRGVGPKPDAKFIIRKMPPPQPVPNENDRRTKSNDSSNNSTSSSTKQSATTPKTPIGTPSQRKNFMELFADTVKATVSPFTSLFSTSPSKETGKTPAPPNTSPKTRKGIVDLCDDSATSDDDDVKSVATQPPRPPSGDADNQVLASTKSPASSSGSSAAMIARVLEMSPPNQTPRSKETITITSPPTSPLVTTTTISSSSSPPLSRPTSAFALSVHSIKISALNEIIKRRDDATVGTGAKTTTTADRSMDENEKRNTNWSIDTQESEVAPDVAAIDDMSPLQQRAVKQPFKSATSPTEPECINVEEDSSNSPLRALPAKQHPENNPKDSQASGGQKTTGRGMELYFNARAVAEPTAEQTNLDSQSELKEYKDTKMAATTKPSAKPTKPVSILGKSAAALQKRRRLSTAPNFHVTAKTRKAGALIKPPGASLSHADNSDENGMDWEASPPTTKTLRLTKASTPSSGNTRLERAYGNKYNHDFPSRTRSSGVAASTFHSQGDPNISIEGIELDAADLKYNQEFFAEDNRRKKKSSDDDEEWESPKEKKRATNINKNGTRKSTRLSTRSGSYGRARRTDEPIEIEDDSSVEEAPTPYKFPEQVYVYDVARIAIGKKICTAGCKIALDKGSLELTFKNPKTDELSPPISIDFDTLRELTYFMAEEESSGAQGDSDDDEISFLSMRVQPADSTGLQNYSNAYCQDLADSNVDQKRKYIVVEFRSDKDFKALLDAMRKTDLGTYLTSECKLGKFQVVDYAQTLVEKNKKDRKQRLSSHGSSRKNRDPFLADRKEKDTLLVYPFPAAATDLSDAVRDLTELKGFSENGIESMETSDAEEIEDDNGKAASADEAETNAGVRGRAHYVTIGVEDYNRLEAPEFFNDTLIDFWMQWMRRGERQSTVHIFTSHFYTTLAEEGIKAVESWTAKRGIDIFEKKFIFVPVNKSLHWSLCVVVNPGSIFSDFDGVGDDDKCPCMIFLDSLKAHRKNEVAKKIRGWLNSEWKRLNKDDGVRFTDKNMPVYDPRIPYQDNCWDCGVFVCRYAFAMYQLRSLAFSFRQMENGRATFITKSNVFRFDMGDINRIREEVKILLQRLTGLYTNWKLEERRKLRAARLAAKTQLTASESDKDNAPPPSEEQVDVAGLKDADGSTLKDAGSSTLKDAEGSTLKDAEGSTLKDAEQETPSTTPPKIKMEEDVEMEDAEQVKPSPKVKIEDDTDTEGSTSKDSDETPSPKIKMEDGEEDGVDLDV